MANDGVTLGFSIRTQLLSLQRTHSIIDTAQLRLATGLTVHSAVDDPQNFFASKSLSNRADDLERLLDHIGQNLQVIKAAANSVAGLGSLVAQAEAVSQQARDLLPTLETGAQAVGDVNLSEINDLTSLVGINNGDRLRFTFRDPETFNINPSAVFVSITTNMSGVALTSAINDVNNTLTEETISATLNEHGQLDIQTINGDIMMIEFISGAAGVGTQTTNTGVARALGFSQHVLYSSDILNQNSVGFTVSPTATLTSFAFEDITLGQVALRSSRLADLRTSGGFNPTFGFLNNNDTYIIGVNNDQQYTIALDSNITVQELIDSINYNDGLRDKILADFNTQTGQITITAIDGDVNSIEIGVGSTDINIAFLGFDVRAPLAFSPLFTPDVTSIRFPPSHSEIRALESEFDNIREQIDKLANDADYRGTNLINGDNMVTFFNEYRSSSLITEGAIFTSEGLGLSEADFSSIEIIESTLTDVRNALETVRLFGTALANDLNIITSRETMTKNIINTLKEGADSLIVADQNEEGAKLLATTVREQMNITSLSLAAQSQQAILALF